MTLKQEIRVLVKKIARLVDERNTDAGIIFLSHWREGGVPDSHSFMQGPEELLLRGFEGAEPYMRRMERCNLNPGPKSTKELAELMLECSRDTDPEVGGLFSEISLLLVGGYPKPLGEAILIVSWNELGISFRRYIEFIGMAQGIVQLFNAGYDSYRKLSTS